MIFKIPFQPKNCNLSVDLATGNLHLHCVDLVIPGIIPISIERHYHSQRTYSPDEQSFNGWLFNFQEKVSVDPYDQSVRLTFPDGGIYRFTQNPDGSYSPAEPWNYFTLIYSEGYFQITFKDQTRHIYNNDGLLYQRVDTHGNKVCFEWNSEHKLSKITDASGRVLDVTYETEPGDNFTMVVKDWKGRQLRYHFLSHDSGTLDYYTDPEGNTTFYDSETMSFVALSSIRFPNGEWVKNYSLGPRPDQTRLGRQEFPNGLEIEYTYNNNRQITQVNCGGRIYSYTYDDYGNFLTEIDPISNTWTYTYDSANRLLTRTDPRLGVTTYTWDSKGNMLTITDALSHTWTYTYHALFNKVLTKTSPAPFSYLTEYDYDEDTGDLLTITDPLTHETNFEYYANGLLKKITDPNSHATEFAYGTHGYMTSMTDPESKVTSFTHDPMGNLLAITDPLNHITRMEYDRNNRVTKVIDALENGTEVEYDGNGNQVLLRDAKNGTTQLFYDQFNMLTSIRNALGQPTEFTYDKYGNRLTLSDARGNGTDWTYDDLDRALTEKDPLGNLISYLYDPYCNKTYQTDAERQLTTTSRDIVCRLTEIKYHDDSFVRSSYDELNRRTAMTQRGHRYGSFKYNENHYGYETSENITYQYDANNRLTQITYPGSKDIVFEYDDAGNLMQVTDIQGTATTYTYTDSNRLLTATREGKTFTCGYDDAHRLTSLEYPNGLEAHYTYDVANRTTKIEYIKDSQTLLKLEYNYDTISNCIEKKTKFGQEDEKIHEYAYDAISQLVNVQEEETRKAAYVFDPAGNRLVKETTNTVLHYTHDAANEMNTADETSFGYDRNGNMIRMLKPSENEPYEYSYDYAQRLAKVTFPDSREAEYNHNGDGHRMYKVVSGEGATVYYWDPGVISGISQVLNEVDAEDNPKADYFYGRGIVPLGIKVGGEYRYYLTDIQGSILALVDDDGIITDRYEYDEYGTQSKIFGIFPNPLGYTGQCHDEETGFIYLRNRYYDPSTGRFSQRDPRGLNGGINLYNYVGNAPIIKIDPLGFWPCPPGQRLTIDWSLFRQCYGLASIRLVFCSAFLTVGPEAVIVCMMGAAGANGVQCLMYSFACVPC